MRYKTGRNEKESECKELTIEIGLTSFFKIKEVDGEMEILKIDTDYSNTISIKPNVSNLIYIS